MNNKLFRLAILFLYVLTTNAVAANYVSSVNAYQSGKNIIITYELSKQSDIVVSVSTDGGMTYKTLKSVYGDVGNTIIAGSKKIVWTVLNEYESFNFSEVCFKVDTDFHNGHEFVDLGLPSGTKWATCNVGATKPEEYGDYFDWGETEPKSYYDWSTYKWCKGDYDTQTKYCTDSRYGIVDNKTTLDLSDDAAYVNRGTSWRMPTKAEQDELRNTSYTTWTWTTQNGIKGYKVTSKSNGNSIFLPAAGYRGDSSLYYAGSRGYYWSGSLYSSVSDCAHNLGFDSSRVHWIGSSRFCGKPVRAVLR